MRNFSLFPVLIILMGVATFVGCTEDTPQTQTPPDLVTPRLLLSTQSVDAEANGGNYTVGYALENGYDDIDIQITCNVQWITNITTDENTIAFDVATNHDTTPRTAELTVK